MWMLAKFLQDLKEALSPAGMRHFIFSHRYTLAISGFFTVLGLALFVFVDLAKSRAAVFQLVDSIEARTLDARFNFRGRRPVDPRLALVAIDDRTVQRYGWPFARSAYARMLDHVCGDGARSVGFDVDFYTPDRSSPLNALKNIEEQMKAVGEAPDPQAFSKIYEVVQKVDSDTMFAQALKRCGNVTLGHIFFEEEERQAGLDPKVVAEYNDILAYHAYPQVRKLGDGRFPFFVAHPFKPNEQFDGKGIEPNLRMFAETAKYTGFFNGFADSDGTYRRSPLVIRYPEKVKTQLEENFFPSLAVETTREYLHAGPQDTIFWFNSNGPERLEMGNKTIHVDISGQVLVNFAGPSGTYPSYSLADVAEGKFSPGAFKDKVVYVGATAVGIADFRPVPFQKAGYPGVEMHLNFTDNILNDNFLRRGFAEEMTDLWVVLVCGVVMGMVFVTMRPSVSWLVFLAAASGLLGFVYWEFAHNGRWLSLVIPAFTLAGNYVGVTTYRVIFEEKEKRKVRGAFGMYLHPGLVAQMMKSPELLRLGGEEAELTVMFSDVRGFTTISERLGPTELVRLLNEYLTVMTDIIQKHWGTVDKYEGDAIMAFWGRPYPQVDHALKACRACLEMSDGLNSLNAKWRAEGRQELNIGIGLNTGLMVVGNMGSNRRFNYTVMGDAVNLGSRLEGQTKEYGTRIIISEATYEYAREEFVCRELDLIRVKGKTKPVAIYELLAPAAEKSKWQPLLEVSQQGLKEYRAGNFDKALEIFEDILSAYPNDGPSKLFVRRSKMFTAAPPAGVWDGVFTATTK